jgi:predicted short-subunit dehydrogenase-like oxidoreductase (DUF2520 family)
MLSTNTTEQRICIVGNGRAGKAFAQAMRAAGVPTVGPLSRGEDIPAVDAVLLCVPERELRNVASNIRVGPLVGHCSASSQLNVLEPHEAFSIHPLMTLNGAHATIAGAACAIDGNSPRALAFANDVALQLGMSPMHVASENRALYHAAASIASNFLVTLESVAERAAERCGVRREALVPLVRTAVENWASTGFDAAITGPLARGDEDTVSRQRSAIAESMPEFVPLFDVMAESTRMLLADSRRHVQQADANDGH